MGGKNSKPKHENVIKKSHNWVRINLACELCLREALLDILHNEKDYDGLPRDEEELYSRMLNFQNSHSSKLKRTISVTQWDKKICPQTGKTCSDKWDISLIHVLIQYHTNVNPPKHRDKWAVNEENLESRDHTLGAWICRAKYFRNELKHATIEATESHQKCRNFFSRMEKILNGLNYKNWELFNDIKSSINFSSYKSQASNLIKDKLKNIQNDRCGDKKQIKQEIEDMKILFNEFEEIVDKSDVETNEVRRCGVMLGKKFGSKGSFHAFWISFQEGLNLVDEEESDLSDNPTTNEPVFPEEHAKSETITPITAAQPKSILSGVSKSPSMLAVSPGRVDKLRRKFETPSKKKVTMATSNPLLNASSNSSLLDDIRKDENAISSKSAPNFFGFNFMMKDITLDNEGSGFIEISTYCVWERQTSDSKNSMMKSRELDSRYKKKGSYHGTFSSSSLRRNTSLSTSGSLEETSVSTPNISSSTSNYPNVIVRQKEIKEMVTNKSNPSQILQTTPNQSFSETSAYTLLSDRLDKMEKDQRQLRLDLLEESSQDSVSSRKSGGRKVIDRLKMLSPKAKRRSQRPNVNAKQLTDISIEILLTPNHKPEIETFFRYECETLRRIKEKVLDKEDLRRLTNGQSRIRRNSAKKKLEKIESFEKLIMSIVKFFPNCTVTNLIEAMIKLNVGAEEIQVIKTILTPQMSCLSSGEFDQSFSN